MPPRKTPLLPVSTVCSVEGCGGECVPIAKDGRFWIYKEVHILVPANIFITRCLKCAKDNPTKEEVKLVTEKLAESYDRHKILILSAFRDYRDKIAKDKAAKEDKGDK